MFVADEMLKKLARWLRLLGVETLYPDSIDDDEIIKFTKKHDKVLLTMDSELCRRARKQGLSVFLMPRKSTEEQLVLLIKRFKLDVSDAPSKVLCPLCNGMLKEAGKKDVKSKVPPEVLSKHEAFWMCKKCKKVFWEGSHWERIKRNLEKVKSMAEG
ncbi:MAG: Mut7-C RNAse domain-containing protein [Candidatus Micrarchaeota archaeon]|nr:Mut7-C RNAse domain-containing protein [Candidatus Micrarchaeota archaeon]